MVNLIPEIILTGTAYQRGVQHGQQLAGPINGFLKDNRARINTIREYPLEEVVIQSQIALHAVIIEAELPEMALELKGLAVGAAITYEDAVLLQIRVELMSYGMSDMLEGDCSTIAYQSGTGGTITGQTIDLPGNMRELGCIFRIMPENNSQPEILMYGFAGLLGYMGMNSFGLSININMVVSNDWQPGISPYLLVRHLLNFSTIDECVAELKKHTRSSSRSLIIGDGTRLVNMEFTANELRVIEGRQLLHTNHFLHSYLLPFDTMHFLFKNSSIKRLKLLQQSLPADDEQINAEMLFNIFADHSLYPIGICAHGNGNIRRSETVAAVVMQPGLFTMYVRKGYACTGETEVFRMKAVRMYKEY